MAAPRPTEFAQAAAAEAFTHKVAVRPSEVDSMGVVHHSQYAVYFEEARTELLRRHGLTYKDVERSGIYLVVIELSTKFKRPARLGDIIDIRCAVSKFTYVTICHEYMAANAATGEVLAEASTVLACVGHDGRPARLPEEVLNALGIDKT